MLVLSLIVFSYTRARTTHAHMHTEGNGENEREREKEREREREKHVCMRARSHTSVCFHFTAMLCEVSFRFTNVNMHLKNSIGEEKININLHIQSIHS